MFLQLQIYGFSDWFTPFISTFLGVYSIVGDKSTIKRIKSLLMKMHYGFALDINMAHTMLIYAHVSTSFLNFN